MAADPPGALPRRPDMSIMDPPRRGDLAADDGVVGGEDGPLRALDGDRCGAEAACRRDAELGVSPAAPPPGATGASGLAAARDSRAPT